MQYPEIESLTEKPSKLVVMLHGLGSDGNDLISLVPFIQKSLPSCHFISPHAIEPYDMEPYGRQWFSVQDRTPSVVLDLSAKAAPLAMKLIEDKQKQLGFSNADTVIIGFSQGAMMGTYLSLSQEKPFAAMVSFSGRMLAPPVIKNNKTPICIIHGQDDSVIECSESISMAKLLTENNIENQILTIPNLMHSIDASGLEFALKFLKNKV